MYVFYVMFLCFVYFIIFYMDKHSEVFGALESICSFSIYIGIYKNQLLVTALKMNSICRYLNDCR